MDNLLSYPQLGSITWQHYQSEWCPEDIAYVIDTKAARGIGETTTDKMINAKLTERSVNFIVISRTPLSLELQMAAVARYLKEKDAKHPG